MSGPRGQSEWREAKDEKSGRTYYYSSITHETRWTKPIELAENEEERQEMLRVKEETLAFFATMENNIRRKGSCGSGSEEHKSGGSEEKESQRRLESLPDTKFTRPSPSSSSSSKAASARGRSMRGSTESSPLDSEEKRGEAKGGGRGEGHGDASDEEEANGDHFYTRTIGNEVEDDAYIRQQLGLMSIADSKSGSAGGGGGEGNGAAQSKASEAKARSTPKRSITVDSALIAKNAAASMELMRQSQKKRQHRNSTGTIFVESTMSSQDNDMTIQCVCIVIRAHLLSSERMGLEPDPEWAMFLHTGDSGPSSPSHGEGGRAAGSRVPSLETIVTFFNLIFQTSQLEGECIIIALIYCERLVIDTYSKLIIHNSNWKSLIFCSLVMASKIWDDLSMWNADFAQICPSYDLERVNELEMAMLTALNHDVRVNAGDYAKYYFRLRALSHQVDREQLRANFARALDVSGALELQLANEPVVCAGPTNSLMRHRKSLDRLRTMKKEKNMCDLAVIGSHRLIGIDDLTTTEHSNGDGSNRTEQLRELRGGASTSSPTRASGGGGGGWARLLHK